MKKYRCYASLGYFAIVSKVLLLILVGCGNELDKHIAIAEGLYRQSVEYKNADQSHKALDKLREALDKYQTVIGEFPNQSADIEDALYRIWSIYYNPSEPAMPDYTAAGLVFEKLAKNYPKGIWTRTAKFRLLWIAHEETRKDNLEDVRRVYQQLVDSFPRNDEEILMAWYELGKANYKLRNYKDARKALGEYISQNRTPTSFMANDARRLIAQSYLDQNPKDFHQAFLNFDKLTTEELRNNNELWTEGMYKTAYCLYKLKIDDEALGRYAEFLTLCADSQYVTDAYVDLGKLYAYNKKDYELARFNYSRALRSAKSPNYSKALIQLEIGNAHYNQGSLKEASAAFNRLLKEYPESQYVSNARRMIAHIHRKEKKNDEAISAYESIIENHADGESDNIRVTLTNGLPLWVNLVAASYCEIGAAFSVKEDFGKAFNSYARLVRQPGEKEKDLRKDPLAPFALRYAMVALCKRGREGELKNFATTYINEVHNDDLILSAQAQLLFAEVLRKELNQYNKAATEYLKLQDYPPKPYPRLNLIKLQGKYYEALCYEKSEIANKSIEAYEEAIRMFDTIFRPLLNNRNIDVPHLTNEQKLQFDFCVQTARYYVGNSYFATNRFAEAIAEFQEFLKKAQPDSKTAKSARDKIEQARRKMDSKAFLPKGTSNTSGDSLEPESSRLKKKLTPEQEITQKARESTVLLIMVDANGKEKGRGTGFFIRSNLIATNYHVIEGAIEGTATPFGSQELSYAIVGYTAIDVDQDLAILKVRAFGIEPTPLGNSDNIEINDHVYVVGTPLGNPYMQGTVSDGKISGLRVNPQGRRIQMTAPISPGNSGGPVLNTNREVIGIASFAFYSRDPETLVNNAQNLNFAVPVNYLKDLLNRAGPAKPLSDS